jgi:hypothetical protein
MAIIDAPHLRREASRNDHVWGSHAKLKELAVAEDSAAGRLLYPRKRQGKDKRAQAMPTDPDVWRFHPKAPASDHNTAALCLGRLSLMFCHGHKQAREAQKAQQLKKTDKPLSLQRNAQKAMETPKETVQGPVANHMVKAIVTVASKKVEAIEVPKEMPVASNAKAALGQASAAEVETFVAGLSEETRVCLNDALEPASTTSTPTSVGSGHAFLPSTANNMVH